MPLKTPKNKLYLSAFFCAMLMVLGLLLPAAPAQAYDFMGRYNQAISKPPEEYCAQNPNASICTRPYTGRVCPIDIESDYQQPDSNRKSYGFVKRIVLCVKDNILAATYAVLVPFSDFFAKTISAMLTLAVVLWGVRTALGQRDKVVFSSIFLLAVKIGAVILFTSNFGASAFDPLDERGGLFGMLIDAVEGMLTLLTGYISLSTILHCPNVTDTGASDVVWERIDCILDSLIGGILPVNGQPPYFSLTFGIVGFLVACFFSGTMGVIIALLGFYLILKFIMALARAVYIFIMSYTAFAMMVLISPMFIPLMLFTSTKAYFEKWYRLTIGFLLQPIFLFAYLSMLIAAFDVVVFTGEQSLYRAIAGTGRIQDRIEYNSVAPPEQRRNYEMGYELENGGVFVEGDEGQVAMRLDPERIKQRVGMNALDSGVADVITEVTTDASDWKKPGGIFSSVLSPGSEMTFFKVNVPTRKVDWDKLAEWSGGQCSDPSITEPDKIKACRTTDYLVSLVLAVFMALITAYIFVAMLDYLPFIGSGIASDSGSMPTFGVSGKQHNLGVPGEGMLGSFRKKLMAKFGLSG